MTTGGIRGSLTLAGVVVLIWSVLYLITQLLVSPALPVLPTLGIGVALTVGVVLGYPSALRGPRGGRSARLGGVQRSGDRWDDPERSVRDLAAAGRSVPLRAGLTPDAARRTCELLRPMLSGDAVTITDRENILAFVGPGSEHHRDGGALQTRSAQRAMGKGRTVVVNDPAGVGCREPGCEIQSAVIAPLRIGTRVIGSLGVFQDGTRIPPKRLVEDMANMLSLHLELAELDRERRLAASARLDALRAQINPHFLFNILNTIASKARTRPEEARELLLRLSEFFRYTVRQEGHFAEFAQEYFFVRTYLSLEQARFGDRLQIRYDIDPQVLTSRVPVLVLQPLVENAVKHGVARKKEGGTVRLRARLDPLTRMVSLRVSDDGVGMDADVLNRLMGEGQPAAEEAQRLPDSAAEGDAVLAGGGEDGSHAGVGLKNITERLDVLFGDRYDLSITAPKAGGTVVDLSIPLR
ncbi:histidine kinase [Nesterenkonia lacusekhoensis]|uniref:Two-component system LytT family sensor kinase n=1 Tax=Nesterenkonia lacusekhoensis TaxID=150832 RepID=A0ABS4T690_9MICC|nr:histidine kinase [Nesterenkonia lacusekhoensis]MBP2319091.1 two-component system LytT family sensor kinase [Nesterenkonia lacusekhoensis]